MPDIPTSGNPSNIETTSTPMLQEWSAVPVDITINYWQGQTMPEPKTLYTIFKDIIGTAQASGYSSFSYRTYIGVISAYPSCVLLSGALATGAGTWNSYTNGLQGAMVYTFQNLNLLDPGIYRFTAYHHIRGRKGLSQTDLLSEHLINVNIRVFTATAPIFTPSSFDFVWTKGQLFNISKSLTISGPSWVLHCPKGFTFSQTSGVVVSQMDDGSYTAEGVGLKTFNLVALPSIEPADIIDNPIGFILSINDFSFQYPINVTFVNESGLFISKDRLDFIAYKGIQNALPQKISTHFLGNYKFVAPAWVTILPSNGSLLLNPEIGVLSAENMAEGQYSGIIDVRKISNNSSIGTIEVFYEVIGKLKSPYSFGVPAFTLDNKFIEFSSDQDNIYFDVIMSVRRYKFYSKNVIDKIATEKINFKVPLFKRKQELNIGLVVDRLMYSMPHYDHIEGIQYKKAEVSLDITERSFTNKDLANKYLINDLTFVAGLSPYQIKGNGYLDVNAGASRVTSNSFFYLNILSSNFYTLSVFKNNVDMSSGFLDAYMGPGVRTVKIDFGVLGAKQGDVFEYRMKIINAGVITKTFKVFPVGDNSNHIVWENEYKLKSVMEFTGKYNIKSEIENKTFSLKDKLVDVLRKLKSTKSSKLIINTGFILNTDVPSVESLCSAKKAAFILSDGVIDLVPIQKTIVSVDNDRELISFDIEFEINRKFNEEIYSF